MVVLGRRMTGKTSLVKTFAREKSGLYVSLMGVKNLVGLAEALLQSPGLELKELELGPATLLRLKLTKTMENIFSRLEGKVVVLDEVQELVSPAFLKLLKTMWDTSRGLRLIFTGSYAGVLKRMLEPGKGSPLYGRQPARIELKPFNKDLAEEFLRLGFAEYRMSPRESEIREAVERLGGAVGWLTYYGNSRCVRRMGHEGGLKTTLREGSKIVLEELKNFLAGRRNRGLYVKVLRMSRHGARCGELRDELQVNDKVLAEALSRLLDIRYLRREDSLYVVADPVVGEAITRLRA